MSFMAGFIAGLSEGGSKSTVGIIEKITSLPVIHGGSVGKSYHYLLHYGNVGNGAPMGVNYYPANNQGGETIYYPCHYVEPLCFWYVLYKNNDNSVVGAAAANQRLTHLDNFFSKQYEYSTRSKTEHLVNDPLNNFTEYEHYLYSLTQRHILGAEASVKKQSYSALVFNFTIHYTDEITYYEAYEKEGDIERPAPDLTVARQETRTGSFQIYDAVQLPFLYTSSAFYTDLSAKKFADEMIQIVREIN